VSNTRQSTTIKDVALQAGVSVATVSRVINNSGPVHAETRRRIVEVADELRYIPNGAARSLITARSNTLGVLLPDLYGEFFSEIIRGIDQKAQQENFQLLLSSSHDDVAGMAAALRPMRGHVDGLIIMSPRIGSDSLAPVIPGGLPLVLLNCSDSGVDNDAVDIDNRTGTADMMKHLLALGHRRIAVLTGSAKNRDSHDRLLVYREMMQRRGIYDPRLEMAGDFTERSGFAGVRELLDLQPRPTALFAFNDAMAIGALSGLREAGVSVPHDLSVAGFDDIPMSRYLNPALTTVRVPISELGAEAIARLIDAVRLGSHHRRRRVTIQTELVVRSSTARPLA
jgi:LacI family transcriptional regulator